MDFFSDVQDVRQRMNTWQLPPFGSCHWCYGSALGLRCRRFYTIILLPGDYRKQRHVRISHEAVEPPVYLIGLILVSQYFIFRYIHGITSRNLVKTFSDSKSRHLHSQMDTTDAACRADQGAAPGFDIVCETTTLLLESKIYQVEKKTILGTFPVYIVNPDLSVLFDKQKLDTIIP